MRNPPTERRVDSVLVFHKEAVPALVVALEVQLTRDPEKRYSWPMYATALRARYRVPTVLLVYAKSNGLAKWCGKPIDLGQPRSTFQPLVLGPSAIPSLPSREAALKHPHLAALAAIAHLGEPDAAEQVARALLAKEEAPDLDWIALYDMMLQGLSEAARHALEELMPSMNGEPYEIKTPWLRESYEKGQAKGRVEGEVKALLAVLDARRLSIASDVRERIESCSDATLLESWLRRAATAAQISDIFE